MENMDNFDPVQGFKKRKPMANGAIAPVPVPEPMGFAGKAVRGRSPLVAESAPVPSYSGAPDVSHDGPGGGLTDRGLLDRAKGAIRNWVASSGPAPQQETLAQMGFVPTSPSAPRTGPAYPLQDTLATPGSSGVTPGMRHQAAIDADYAAAAGGQSGAQAAALPSTARTGSSFPAPALAPQQAIVDAQAAKQEAAPVPAPAPSAPVRTPADDTYDKMTLAQAQHNNRWVNEAQQRYDAQRNQTPADRLKASIPQLSPQLAAMFPDTALALNSAGPRIDMALERRDYRRGFRELQENNAMRRAEASDATQRRGQDAMFEAESRRLGEQGRQFDTQQGLVNEVRGTAAIDDAVKNSPYTKDPVMAQQYREFLTQNKVPGTDKSYADMTPAERLANQTDMRHAFEFNKHRVNTGPEEYGKDTSTVLPQSLKRRPMTLGDVSHSGSLLRKVSPWSLPNLTDVTDDQGRIREYGLTSLLGKKIRGMPDVYEDERGGVIDASEGTQATSKTGRGDIRRIMKKINKNAPVEAE